MYAGQIVEVSDAFRFFKAAASLFAQVDGQRAPLARDQEPEFITGQPPSLLNPPTGCRFADRCSMRFEKCAEEPPTYRKRRHRS